jgi:hypothetical protein
MMASNQSMKPTPPLRNESSFVCHDTLPWLIFVSLDRETFTRSDCQCCRSANRVGDNYRSLVPNRILSLYGLCTVKFASLWSVIDQLPCKKIFTLP